LLQNIAISDKVQEAERLKTYVEMEQEKLKEAQVVLSNYRT
jgi:hypothetical protein